jgi:hypothetical protein
MALMLEEDAMPGVRVEDDEAMLPLAPEIQNFLKCGRIAKLDGWLLMNIKLGQRGPFLAGTIAGQPEMFTARLVLFRPDLGYAVTKNTIYILGKKRLDYWRNICLAMKKTFAGRSASRRMK